MRLSIRTFIRLNSLEPNEFRMLFAFSEGSPVWESTELSLGESPTFLQLLANLKNQFAQINLSIAI